MIKFLLGYLKEEKLEMKQFRTRYLLSSQKYSDFSITRASGDDLYSGKCYNLGANSLESCNDHSQDAVNIIFKLV